MRLSAASRHFGDDIISQAFSQLKTVKTEFNGIPETKHRQSDPEDAEHCSGIRLGTHFSIRIELKLWSF